MKTFFNFGLALLMTTLSALAGASNLRLGPGDLIKISVFGEPSLSVDTKVSDAGNISYPLLGDVRVEGLSPTSVEKKIALLLESGGFLRKAEVNVELSLSQSLQVSVLGHVNRPGRYPLDGRRSLTDIIALAGGVSPEGADIATLIRAGDGTPSRETIDLLEIMREANIVKNVELRAGDVIYVERAPKFYIYGEVQRPGAYRLDRNMTVVQALSAGGGLTPRGTERGMRIKRRDATGQLKVLRAKHDDVLEIDDVLHIQESLF